MRIPVGVQTTTSATEEVGFRCGTCNHRQRAEVEAIGTGAQSFLNSRGTAARRARKNARAEIKRTIRFATCPKCNRRSGYLKFLLPYVLVAAFFLAVGIVAGYAPIWFDVNMRPDDKFVIAHWVPLVFAVGVAVVTPLVAWSRWAVNDKRVTWLNPSSS